MNDLTTMEVSRQLLCQTTVLGDGIEKYCQVTLSSDHVIVGLTRYCQITYRWIDPILSDHFIVGLT